MNDTSYFTFQYDIANNGDYLIEDERITIESSDSSEAKNEALNLLVTLYPNCSVHNIELVKE